jgi:hypothetical protein
MRRYAMFALVSAVVAIPCIASAATNLPADRTAGFVFTETGVYNSAKPTERVNISEKIAPSKLRKRFPGYKFRVAQAEDCSTCAFISGAAGNFEVFYGNDGVTVTAVMSYDKKASDSLGNRPGGLFIDAVGNSAPCDVGMWRSCSSPKVKGLSYIVDDEEACPFIQEGDGIKSVPIPSCLKIDGFVLESPQHQW